MSMSFPKSFARFFSTSVLLTLLGAITLTTNFMLASLLPMATSPHWNSPHGVMSSEYESDILHVVTTRFMQNQPLLLNLGKARLLIFEIFCLPTMINQNIDNFLWFIMTDPNLDPSLLEHLKSLLAPYPNFHLVLSNAKLVTPYNLTKTTTELRILTGDVDKLYSLMLDLNRPLLLETRLDADDGLHRKTLSEIQREAQSLPNDTEGWQVICNKLHYEWRNDDITALNKTVKTSGKLRLVKEGICVTPGYTLVRHREPASIDFPAWPRIGHHLINREWPICFDEKNNSTTNCWTKLKSFPAALRVRTITSAGMNRVETGPNESIYDNQTDIFWHYVQKDYGITPEKAHYTSLYLQENLPSIVEDNLKGQW
jgi:hypothetical protein